jgi:putative transposase
MAAPRIHGFPYQGQYFYFITLCCDYRENHFKNADWVEETLIVLKSNAQWFDFRIWAYCFMPDHVHFLVAGGQEADLWNFIHQFKQASGFNFKRKTGKKLWQRSFYEHVLREEEDVSQVCLYIFQNPMEAGLVKDFREWPFSGSEVFEWKNFP